MNNTPSSDPLEPIPIVYKDERFLVVDKPAGLYVHQPEFPRRRVARELTCLYRLRTQTGFYVYPAHRIDFGTSGLLIFALQKEAASLLGRLFTNGGVEKEYIAIVRGYTPDEGSIDVPLESDSSAEMLPSLTSFRTLARVELPHAVGKRHSTARYSLIRARPHSGRFHQIRRHMARISHPLLADAAHGDSHHNRFFREVLGLNGLWLRADALSFDDPTSGSRFEFHASLTPVWREALERLGIDPAVALKDPTATFAPDRVPTAPRGSESKPASGE